MNYPLQRIRDADGKARMRRQHSETDGSLLQSRICLALTLLSVLIVIDIARAEWSSSVTQNLPLCTAENEQRFPVLIADGQGGTIVAWSDARHANRDVFAQRVSATGDMHWNENGIPICDLPSSQSWPLIASDTMGGAILVWGDTRHGNQDSYAQRIDANGNKLWDSEGMPVCTHPTLQDDLNAIADGKGGIIAVWEDWRNGNQDIYAQRIDRTGKPFMGSKRSVHPFIAGMVTSMTQFSSQMEKVVLFSHGGTLALPIGIFLRKRLSAEGKPLWNSGDGAENAPIPVCTAMGNQGAPVAVTDGKGGVFFVWSDYRNDPHFYTTCRSYMRNT